MKHTVTLTITSLLSRVATPRYVSGVANHYRFSFLGGAVRTSSGPDQDQNIAYTGHSRIVKLLKIAEWFLILPEKYVRFFEHRIYKTKLELIQRVVRTLLRERIHFIVKRLQLPLQDFELVDLVFLHVVLCPV
jgi:hypothetical protein